MLFKHDGVLYKYLTYYGMRINMNLPTEFDSFFFGSNDRALIFNKIKELFDYKQRNKYDESESVFVGTTFRLHQQTAIRPNDIALYMNDFIEMGFIEGELNLIALYVDRINEDFLTECRVKYVSYYALCKATDDLISPFSHDLEIPELEFIEEKKAPRIETTPNPKLGYIYLIESDNYYKIGKSKNVPERFSSIKLLLPKKSRLVTYTQVEKYNRMEKAMHSKFDHLRMNGEWFDLGKNAETLFIDAINELK